MGSYRWHCSSCCELSAPRGLSASSNCLSAGIPAPLQECTPCAEPEKGLRVQQDAPLKYNAIQIKLDAPSSDKPLRTKERKISPSIHCKNILSKLLLLFHQKPLFPCIPPCSRSCSPPPTDQHHHTESYNHTAPMPMTKMENSNPSSNRCLIYRLPQFPKTAGRNYQFGDSH